MKKQAVIFAVAAALLTGACSSWTEPVYNPRTTLTASYEAEDVKKAIHLAFINRGWTIIQDEPGLIRARLRVRGHEAEVEVPYTATGYSINYISSVGLKAGGGQIHNKYNNWVNNIDYDIKRYMQNNQIFTK